jgi:CO dehydrogenase/acetyl-CoA synthase alpha subunit
LTGLFPQVESFAVDAKGRAERKIGLVGFYIVCGPVTPMVMSVLAQLSGPTQVTRMRVLVVEDEFLQRHELALTLGAAGYEVDEAADGQIALKRMGQQLPHLILLDLRACHG